MKEIMIVKSSKNMKRSIHGFWEFNNGMPDSQERIINKLVWNKKEDGMKQERIDNPEKLRYNLFGNLFW